MNRDQKTAVVDELAEQIRSADAIFAVDYRGISVSEAAELRAKLRDAGARFRVVKNSLTERASDAAGADSLKAMLEGPTALTFVGGDAALAAKALNDAARALGTLEFKGGLMDGATLSADDVRSIARLPAREVLHGQLVGTIAAPLSGLVRTLNALISGLAVQLGQIAEQGLVSGEAASASEAADEAPAEPEAAESAAEDASGSESVGLEAEAEQSEPGGPDSETDATPEAEQSETEARSAADADSSADEPKED